MAKYVRFTATKSLDLPCCKNIVLCLSNYVVLGIQLKKWEQMVCFCDKLPVTKCLKTKLSVAKLSFLCRQNTGSSLEVGVFLMFESLQKA